MRRTTTREGRTDTAGSDGSRPGRLFTEVASTLVRLRLARGLRQEDLARALGKSQPSIARWEAEDYDGYTLKELSRWLRRWAINSNSPSSPRIYAG